MAVVAVVVVVVVVVVGVGIGIVALVVTLVLAAHLPSSNPRTSRSLGLPGKTLSDPDILM